MADAKITYNAEVIAEINGGQTATLKCKGMKMDDDVTVESLGGGGDLDGFIEGTMTELTSGAGTVRDYAAYQCSALTTVDFPNATRIGSNAFYRCSALTTANFPNATSLGSNALSYCSALTTVDFPNATSIENYALSYCYALTTVDFPNATSLGNSAFSRCFSLTAVILRSETLCTLANTNAFTNCYHILGTVHPTYNPDGLKDGYIYVPSALVAEYQAATNWSGFATQFRALEDYTVDGTITGELDPEKI